MTIVYDEHSQFVTYPPDATSTSDYEPSEEARRVYGAVLRRHLSEHTFPLPPMDRAELEAFFADRYGV